MANVNRVLTKDAGKLEQPKFASGSCKYGTIGKSSSNGDLYMWTFEGHAVNLRTGGCVNNSAIGGLNITPLRPFATIQLSVNEEQ